MGLVLLSFLVRVIISVRDSLCLDEIWSLNFALAVDHWWEAFTKIRSVNSHAANTAWMHLVGLQEYWGWYRLPAVLCGTAAVALVACHRIFGSQRQRLLGAFLMAASYPFVHYSAEARGYTPAALCALLAYLCLKLYWEKKSLVRLAGFHLSIIIGLTWHLSFIFIIAAFGFWIVWRNFNSIKGTGPRLRESAALLLPFGMFTAVFYLIFIRHLTNEGGKTTIVWDGICNVFGNALGGPDHGPLALFSVLIVLSLIFCNGYKLWRQRSPEWVFRTCALLLMPAIIVASQNTDYIYYRYFLVCFPFLYLLIAEEIMAAWHRTSWQRITATVFLILITTFHVGRTANLMRYGRGDGVGAVLSMASQTKRTQLDIGSDHDFRIKMMLFYYGYFVPKELPVVYHDWNHWPKDGVEWVIAHHSETRSHFTRNGIVYRLDATYPFFGGDAGMKWDVYRNIGPASSTANQPAANRPAQEQSR
ncbi:MAG TPA: glycosyltransferase family 39 protein [Verrucomicrobiae bacterium]